MAEEEDSLEAEIVYPITCGDSKANLIWRKFVCPGINVKCVQVRTSIRKGRIHVHQAPFLLRKEKDLRGIQNSTFLFVGITLPVC